MKQIKLLTILLLSLIYSCTEDVYMIEAQPNITREYLTEATLSERNTYNYWCYRADTLSVNIHLLSGIKCATGVDIDSALARKVQYDYYLYVDKAKAMHDQYIYQYKDGYLLCDNPEEAYGIKITHDSLRLEHLLFKERMLVTFMSIDKITDN